MIPWWEKFRTPPAHAPAVPTTIQGAAAGDPQAAKYAQAALNHACDNIATAPKGTRNDTLNSEAYSIGQLVKAGHLDNEVALSEMWQAARACGLGDAEINRTIPRAIGDAEARNVVLDEQWDVPDAQIFTPQAPKAAEDTNTHTGDTNGLDGDSDDAEAARAAYIAHHVEREKLQLEIRDTARRQWEADQAATTIEDIPTPTPGEDFLSVEDPPVTWLLQGLQPVGTNALLAAQAKSGKTTMVTNLVKALLDGDPFLGEFLNEFDGTVTLIDDELDDRMLRRWLKNIHITHPEKLRIVTLRGRLSTFNIVDDTIRTTWANNLAGTDYLILDCLRPALDACGLDENREAGIFLNAYGELLKQAGIESSLVVHHMGHESQRSRGDSRIMDWPDVLWKLTRKDPEDHTSSRYFEAFGREVNVDRRELHYFDGTLTMLEEEQSFPDPTTPLEWMVISWLRHAAEKPRSKQWWKEQASIDCNEGRYSPGSNEAYRLVDQMVANGVFLELSSKGGKVYTPAPSNADVKRLASV